MEFGPWRLNDYLAQLAPGPELGTALGAIDPSSLCGHDAVSFMHSQYRQVAHEQGRLLLAVSHVARCGFDEGQHAQRMSDPDQWSTHEVKAALGLTRTAGDELVALAWDVVDRAPEVGAAMLAGELDVPRAKVLLTATVGLADSVQASVLGNTIPLAALSGPRWTTGNLAEYATALATALDPYAKKDQYESGVRRRRVIASPNPDGTADLSGRQLAPERVAAAAARIDVLAKAAKRDGDPRPIDHLRAEIFLCLTEGTWAGFDDAAILDALRASRPGQNPTAARPLDGIELRLPMDAALGAELVPGALAGFGPIHTEHARAVLARLGAAQWRWVLLDDSGHLMCSGLTPIRPIGYAARSVDCSSVVDLYVYPNRLEAWAEAAVGGDPPEGVDPEIWDVWRRVAADIAERAAAPPPLVEDPDRRFAGVRMRREIQIAHGRCIGVGCRAPARKTDLDHRRDHAKGGETTVDNQAPACRRDHMAKTKGGWTLERTETGHRWTSRLRHAYDVPLAPVWRTLPDPVSDADERDWPPLPEPDGEVDGLGRHWAVSNGWSTAVESPPF